MSLLMIIGKDQKTPDAEEKDATTHSYFMSPRTIECLDYLRTKGVVDVRSTPASTPPAVTNPTHNDGVISWQQLIVKLCAGLMLNATNSNEAFITVAQESSEGEARQKHHDSRMIHSFYLHLCNNFTLLSALFMVLVSYCKHSIEN